MKTYTISTPQYHMHNRSSPHHHHKIPNDKPHPVLPLRSSGIAKSIDRKTLPVQENAARCDEEDVAPPPGTFRIEAYNKKTSTA